MKLILFFIISCFSFSHLIAQQLQGKVFRPSAKNTDKMSVIDSCNFRIWYSLNADDISDPKSYIDLQRLEVGKQKSKYCSDWVFTSDSLCTAWIKANPQAQSVPRKLGMQGKYPDFWSEYKFSEYFKDYKTNLLTEYARMPMYMRKYDSQYTEEIPKQNWNISNDTLIVNGYLCQKAICNFRGRSYTAWFTMDIPISNGPWKFGGLPGLILKVYDNDHLYVFECIKIENIKCPIRQYDYSSFRIMDRKKLIELQKAINENYCKVSGAISRTGKPFKSVSYEPLELE